jgi:hypothetical protein
MPGAAAACTRLQNSTVIATLIVLCRMCLSDCCSCLRLGTTPLLTHVQQLPWLPNMSRPDPTLYSLSNPHAVTAHTRHTTAAYATAYSQVQAGLLTLPEAVLEAAWQVLEVPHAASAGGLTANGLLAPLVCAQQQSTARRASTAAAAAGDTGTTNNQRRPDNDAFLY